MNIHPVLKGLIFSLIPLAYYLMGFLNYSQAGKSAGLAFFALTPLFFWRQVLPTDRQQRIIHGLLVAVALIIIINMGFHGFLRTLFGMQQDDVAIMEALFNTTPSESSEFLLQNIRFIGEHLLIAFSFFTIYWLLFIRKNKQQKLAVITPARKTLVGAIVFTLLLVLVHFNPTLRRFNPIVYFPYYYIKWENTVTQTILMQEALAENMNDPQLASMQYHGPDQKTVVFVIGESDTRHNWSLYGYERNTNAELIQHKDHLLIFKNVLAADGATIGSLQKMLTSATLKSPNEWQKKPDILTIAKRLGYKVFWIDNQGMPNRGVISIFASHANETVYTNKSGNLGESSFDTELLAPYQKALNDPADKKFIILHMTGQHPAYNFRYPENFAIFDSMNDVIAKKLSLEGRAPWAILMRNQYDNAVRYLDHNLNTQLEMLKKQYPENSAWLYIADHGQDVAHHSNFSGHNKNAREMWEVPMIYWSSSLEKNHIRQFDRLAQQPYQADVIDSTLLGILSAEGVFYNTTEDILSEVHKALHTNTAAKSGNLPVMAESTL